jgi:hypothetical protein
LRERIIRYQGEAKIPYPLPLFEDDFLHIQRNQSHARRFIFNLEIAYFLTEENFGMITKRK